MLQQVILIVLLTIFFSSHTLAADPFRFRVPFEPKTLDWIRARTINEAFVLTNIMEGLVTLDESLRAVPALAESREISEDGLTYVFHLRKDVLWSDGKPLNAEDFVFAWKRLLSEGSKNIYFDYLYDIKNAEAFSRGTLKDFSQVGVETRGSHTLIVHLYRRVPSFLGKLAFWTTFPMRKDLFAKYGDKWWLPENIVTLGAYQIKKWSKGKELLFERNPHYYGNPPPIEQFLAVVEQDNSKSLALFKQGKIDLLWRIGAQDLLRISADSALSSRLRRFPTLGVVFLAFNVRSQLFKQKELREAIARGIDRKMITSSLPDEPTPAESLLPKNLLGYEPGLTLPFSQELARSLLPEGRNLPKIVLSVARGEPQESAAYFIRDSLKSTLGVPIETISYDPKKFREFLKKGDFQAYVGHWTADYPDPSSFLDLMLSDNGHNRTGWKNPDFDSLVRSADANLNVVEREKQLAAAQRILIHEDIVLIPIFYPWDSALVGPDVTDFKITPLNYFFFKDIKKARPSR